MPKLLLPIPSTELNITRPVVLEIARKLFKVLGIHPSTRIEFPMEGDDKVAQAGSTMGTTERDEANYLPFSQKIKIEVDEQYFGDAFSSTAVHRPEHFPVFRDDDLFVLMKPAYSNNEITISFKFRTADKTLATRWRDEVRMRHSDSRDQYVHSVSYSWEPPVAFMKILQEIHRLRENVLPYGDDFNTYYQEHADARSSVVVNQAGTQGAWTISETQGEVTGYFDFTGNPEKGSKEGEGEAWMTAFSYKFRFEAPLACNLVYPISVHSQLLSADWRPSKSDDQNKKAARSAAKSIDALNHFRVGKTREAFAMRNGYDIPTFDEFIPGSVISETQRIFCALVNVNFDDKEDLLNLAQLGKIHFTPLLLAFLKVEAPYMAKTYNSVFTLSLYEGIDLHRSEAVTVDANLNVRSRHTIDPRKVYHVRLAIVTNWNMLTPAAIARLEQNGAAAIELIKAINPNAVLPPLTNRGNIAKPPGLDGVLLDHGNTAAGPNGSYTGQHVGFNTVATLFIEAHKAQ